MATDNLSSTSSTSAALTGKSKGNVYDTAATTDYTDAIAQMYDNSTAETQQSIQNTVDTGTANLGKIQSMGEGAYQQQYDAVQNDYTDSINTRNAIEEANGNRGGIGHSQYGEAEQSLAYQRAAIAANIQQLKTDTARQISDLRAQGDYQAADAALSNMQAKLKQMYTDQLKQDTNLYQSYTYEYGLQREDAQEQAEQAETDKAYLRTWALQFLQLGIMPTQEMLDAIGMTAEEAEPYRAYYVGTGSYSGSGSGSGSGTGGTGGTSGSTSTENKYASAIQTALDNKNSGSAEQLLAEATTQGVSTSFVTKWNTAISDSQAQSKSELAAANKKESQLSGNQIKNTDYWTKYYG